MDITVSKSDILQEVEKRTSLEGVVIPDRFEDVWASKEDGELLDSFWVEGCSFVVQLFKRYVSSVSGGNVSSTYNGSESFTLNATMPTRYPAALDNSVASDVKMIIACNMVLGWLNVKLPTAAAKYKEEGEGYAEGLKSKLLYRTSPTNTLNAATADNEEFSNTEADLTKKTADSETIASGKYFADGGSDEEKLKSGEYISKESAEEEDLASGKYFAEKSKDDQTITEGNYYSESVGDGEAIASGEYFAEKDVTELYVINEDYYTTKEEDNYNFKQYEKCNNYPKEGRDDERCCEHCSCNR